MSILVKHAIMCPDVKNNRKRIQKWNKGRNEMNCWRKSLKYEQLRCNCHCPAPRIASRSNRWPGVSGLMAGGMCSYLPFISLPGASFAIFWASRICRVRGRSPALSTVKLKVVGSHLLAGCSSSRCRAMELASMLPLICFSWVSILAWALKPVSPLYLISHKERNIEE